MVRKRVYLWTLISMVALIGAVLVPAGGTALADPAPCIPRTGTPEGLWPLVASRGTCITVNFGAGTFPDYLNPSEAYAVVTMDAPHTSFTVPINADWRVAFRVPEDTAYGWRAVTIEVYTAQGKPPVLGSFAYILMVVPGISNLSQFFPVIPIPPQSPNPPFNLNRPFLPFRP